MGENMFRGSQLTPEEAAAAQAGMRGVTPDQIRGFFAPGTYGNINQVSDYSVYDPYGYAKGIQSGAGGLLAGAAGMLGPGGYTALAGAGGRGGAAPTYDPTAAYGSFLGGAAAIPGLVGGALSPLQAQLDVVAARESQNALGTAAQNFSAAGSGALMSGAGARAMGEAMAAPFAQAQAQIAGQQVGLTGNLWQQLMGQMGEQTMFGAQFGEGARQFDRSMGANQLMAAMGLASQNYGTGLQGLLGGGGMYSGTVAPQYVYNPGGLERLLQTGGAVGSTVSAFAPLFGMGG